MKILKLKSDKLTQIAAGVAYKSFIHSCSKIEVLHNNPENATGYLLVPSQKFKDETKAMFIIGDLTTAWVKYARAIKKVNDKNVLWGQCFAKKQTNGITTIELMDKTGKAKLSAFLKLTEVKTVLKKAKATIVWATGLSDESEETKDIEDDFDVLEKATPPDRQLWDRLTRDAASIKKNIDESQKMVGGEKEKAIEQLLIVSEDFLEELDEIDAALPVELQTFRNALRKLHVKWSRQRNRKSLRQTASKVINLFKKFQG